MLYEKERHALTGKVSIHIIKGIAKQSGIIAEGDIQRKRNGIAHEFQFSDGERRLIAEKLFGNTVDERINAECRTGIIGDITGQGEDV